MGSLFDDFRWRLSLELLSLRGVVSLELLFGVAFDSSLYFGHIFVYQLCH